MPDVNDQTDQPPRNPGGAPRNNSNNYRTGSRRRSRMPVILGQGPAFLRRQLREVRSELKQHIAALEKRHGSPLPPAMLKSLLRWAEHETSRRACWSQWRKHGDNLTVDQFIALRTFNDRSAAEAEKILTSLKLGLASRKERIAQQHSEMLSALDLPPTVEDQDAEDGGENPFSA